MSQAVITLGRSFLPIVDGRIRDRFVVCEGPRGTGKSRAILTCLVSWACKYPGSRWLIIRANRTRLTQTALATLEEQVFPSLNMKVPGGANRENRSIYNLPNGSQIVPLGLDDPQRTQSAEYCGAYVNEVVEIESLNTVSALAGGMRQDNPAPHMLFLDANPAPPNNWVNQIANPVPAGLRQVKTIEDYKRLLAYNTGPVEPGKWRRIITRIQDNPHYFDTENWRLTKAGADYMETLDYLTGYLRQQWVDGEWVAASGGVFANDFRDDNIVEDFDIPEHWPFWCHVDPGYDHPCAKGWFTISPNGTIYVAKSSHIPNQDIAFHTKNINEFAYGKLVRGYRLDPRHGFMSTAQSPKTIAQQFRELGINFEPWPRKAGSAVEALVNDVRQLLRAKRLKFFRNAAASAIMEMQSWSYKRNTKGEQLNGDDAFEDRNNDFIDGLLGFIAMNNRFENLTADVY